MLNDLIQVWNIEKQNKEQDKTRVKQTLEI